MPTAASDRSEGPLRRLLRRSGIIALTCGWLSVLFLGLSMALAPAVSHAETPRIKPRVIGNAIDEIRVRGNRRASADEVRYNISSEVGATLDPDVISQDIKRIYKMGFFEDVQVDADYDAKKLILTFYLKEKPAVALVTYEGNDELDEDDFKDHVDLRVPSILDMAKVTKNEEKLQALYSDKGYYLAEVKAEVLPMEGGDVEVRFKIREFSKISVKSVKFIGNKAISDDELKGNIFTREASLLGFLTGAGEFKAEEFSRDLQRISFYYADHGYPDVKVSDPQVNLSPDRESMFVVIHIDEGELYHVGDVKVSGDLLTDDPEALKNQLQISSGNVFKLSEMFKDIETLRNIYRDAGYAFVNVEPKQRKNTSKNEIFLTYDIKKGEQVHFGQIIVTGNDKTADKVIRRELLIAEGELFNGSNLERSKNNAMRLGFFEKVDITTNPSVDPRYVNVQVEVKERPTGTFQVGAGFSSVESFIATIQVSQNNFLGRGQTLTAQATFSGIRQLFNIQFFEPYFLDTKWRFRATVFNFEFLFNDFSRSSTGGTLGFGYPLTRFFVIDLTYTIEDVQVEPGGRLGRARRNIGSLFQGGLTSSIQTTLSYDTRNNRLFPSQGYLLQGVVEFADDTLLSENEFTRLIGRVRFYFPLFLSFVLKFNIEAGLVSNWNADNTPVPIFERFFVGGPNSVRGFLRSSLGPSREIAANAGDPGSALTTINIGGNKQFIFNMELEFPILTSVGIKGVLFADAGNSFDNDQDLSVAMDIFSDSGDYTNILRTALGFGFRWFSPIGPLRFEWGIPLAPLPEEDSVVFEFSIGNSF